MDKEERCLMGSGDSDCPGERREVQCPEGMAATADCPTTAPPLGPEGGLETPECPYPDLNDPTQCTSSSPGVVDCVPFKVAGPEDCPAVGESARTDCPLVEAVPEDSPSTETGSGGDVAVQRTGRVR